ERLLMIDLVVHAREPGPPHVGAWKRSLERRIELRLARVDDCLPGFARSFERREEMQLIANDRSADCDPDRMPAVLGLRRAGVVQFLFEPVDCVEALV